MDSPETEKQAGTHTVLLIHAHSEADSFVSAMRDTIRNELAGEGWTITESDLYAMGFNPVLSPSDFPSRKNEDHLVYALEQRHAYETGTLPAEITEEIAKVLAADLLIFTFPIFWFSLPAILKGWIDRVWISGPFYGGRRIYGSGGLRGKRALAVFSLGGREHMFGPGSLHGELETGLLRHFLQGTLGYTGLEVIAPFTAYHVPYLSQNERAGMLEQLRRYVADLDSHPVLPMPNLDAFDASFAPLGA
ncbi:NAD(P)H dehydrogenase (plasmid) [Sphingomonas panacis]|uniref:NAD(P)H dehydrogenase n=1 Tax=Sphingomonas panacis TaxID=1560345 RepID=A0A1B3ZIJ7_9SPHN|nr:NAD(P)H-dependent oxidoreductase [Sphingomonas panacis]AOH87236.1 NAD(P)H dehydrogenase [Sphingomonas panacis]